MTFSAVFAGWGNPKQSANWLWGSSSRDSQLCDQLDTNISVNEASKGSMELIHACNVNSFIYKIERPGIYESRSKLPEGAILLIYSSISSNNGTSINPG